MRIGCPRKSEADGRQVLAAPVSIEAGRFNVPETLEFSIAGSEPVLSVERADPFLVSMIPVAMKLGEDIHVEAPISARLAHGLDTYQRILATWWPETFTQVSIHYQARPSRTGDRRPDGVGCTFSGGLDSWHAVYESLPRNCDQPGFQVTHALMINGFDQLTDLEHQGLADQMFSTYQPALAQWGVELLMLETNGRLFKNEILSRRESIRSYGASLGAAAHALAGMFGRFGVAGHATYTLSELKPKGSHVALDHHLGSDQLQIIHAGTSASRAEKLDIMVDEPIVQKTLRVCFHPPKFDPQSGNVINCGECEKCVRTIASLLILDKLGRFESFAGHRPVSDYQRPEVLASIQDMYISDMSALAQKHGRSDWIYLLERARNIRHNARNRQAAQTA